MTPPPENPPTSPRESPQSQESAEETPPESIDESIAGAVSDAVTEAVSDAAETVTEAVTEVAETAMSGARIALLLLVAALPLATMNMFVPSLDTMAEEFGVGYATVAWSISGFLAAAGMLQIFVGQAADRFGRRPVLVLCLGFFTLASVGCALAPDFTTFIVFRVMQSVVIAGLVLSRAIVNDTVDRRHAASILGYIAVGMSLAPMLGPILGGVMAEAAGWRSIFWIYTAAGFLLAVFMWYRLPETGARSGTTTLQFLANYLRLLATPLFWVHSLILAFSIGGFFVFVAGIPLVGVRAFDFNPAQIGMAVGVISAGFLVGSILSGRMSVRVGLTGMILAGRVVGSIGILVAGVLMLAGWVTPLVFLGGVVLVGFGNGLSNPSGNVSVMNVHPALAASAAGLSGAVVLVTASALTSVTGLLLAATLAPQILPFTLIAVIAAITFASLLLTLFVVRHEAGQKG